jgi:dolichol-phosphate mannosyltransferase
MTRVSVVLPTFNERDNIVPLMDGIGLAIPDAQIVVVDDNSPDGTAQLVEEYAQSHPNVLLVLRTTQSGLTTAIQAGIDASSGAVVFWMDCDLSMPTSKMPELLATVERGADVAIGSRYIGDGEDRRHETLSVLMSATINLLAKAALGGRVRDFTTGFVAARRAVLDAIRLDGDYGEYCIDFLARAERAGFRVEEVGYHLTSRTHGESKTAPDAFGFVRRGPKYIRTIARLALASPRPPR